MDNLKTQIFKNCKRVGLVFDSKGYVKHPQLNLISDFDNWIEIKNELEEGLGGELKPDKNGLIKFNAVHSSSALCVNNFALIKKDINNFSFRGYDDFIDSSFEKKLHTGISTPHLDFYLESAKTIIGFESKYTEYFNAKLPNHEGNLTKYLNRNELGYLPEGFPTLLQKYADSETKMHLDVAQLIKHSIGLIKRQKERQQFLLYKNEEMPVLVYIYWQPINSSDYKLFETLRDEIENFKMDINNFIPFISMTYNEFWEMYENNVGYKNHFKKVKERYNISL